MSAKTPSDKEKKTTNEFMPNQELPMKTEVTVRAINAQDGDSKDYLENFLKPISEDLDESTFHFVMYDLDGTLKFFNPDAKPGEVRHGSILGGDQALTLFESLQTQGCHFKLVSAAPQSSEGLGTVNKDLISLNPRLAKIFGDPDFPQQDQFEKREHFLKEKARLFKAYQFSKIKERLAKFDASPAPTAGLETEVELKSFYDKQVKNYGDIPTTKQGMDEYLKKQELISINEQLAKLFNEPGTVRNREEIGAYIKKKEPEFKEMLDAKPGTLVNMVEEEISTNEIDPKNPQKFKTEPVNVVHYKNIMLPRNRKAEAVVIGIRDALSEMPKEKRDKIKKIKIHALDDYISNSYQIPEAILKYLTTIQELCPQATLEIDSAWLQLKPVVSEAFGASDSSYTGAMKPLRDGIGQFNKVSGNDFIQKAAPILQKSGELTTVKATPKDAFLKSTVATVDPNVKTLRTKVRDFLFSPIGKDPSWKENQNVPQLAKLKEELGLKDKVIHSISLDSVTYVDTANGTNETVTKTIEELSKMKMAKSATPDATKKPDSPKAF